jgi:putative membrane protein
MMWDGYGWGGAGAWFMLLFMLVFVAAIVVGIVLLVRALGTGGGTGREEPRPRRDDARELLRRRYAAGEIDREEYLRRRQDLDDDS